ncbi:unnamed protein product [Mytilus edulis]|uniref:B box-type domain-containing protein n=1 Tax=Mytilus edulis TaxID=6550 RepID=A0A8S3UAN2_MYTED|nr:unnamed protein product [Mytilus edulis]
MMYQVTANCARQVPDSHGNAQRNAEMTGAGCAPDAISLCSIPWAKPLPFTATQMMASGNINCEFCSSSTDTKWKCDDCNLSLCGHCNNKIHTTIPALFEHNVQEIKDTRNKEGEHTKTFDLKLVQCLQHTEKNGFAYCTSCNKSLCTDCLVKPNQYDKLSEIVSERMEQLKKVKDKIEEDLPFFIENIDKLKTFKAERQAKYDEIKRQVIIKEEEIKDSIANKAVSLIKELDDWWTPQSDQISKMEETLKNAEEDLMHRKAIIEEVFTSEDTTSIFTAVDQVLKELPIKIVVEIKKPESLRFSTENSTINLQVGSLMKIPELRVVDTYKYDATNKLAIVNADLHVGFDESNTTLNLFVFTKTKCYTVKSASIRNKINDITVTPKKSILFTEIGTSSIIYKHEENSGKATFIDIRPKQAKAIHANPNDDKLIVGYMNHINLLERLQIVMEDEQFNVPNVITTNINGDICVIDTTNTNWEGRVIVLESLGKFKWMYKGHNEINTEHAFSPRDIVTTSTGDIFVSDGKSSAVHVLSMDGIFITSIGEKEGIQNPMALSIDHEGRMLIGCSNKLYVVDIKNN